MKAGWINSGMIVDGVQQLKGFDIYPCCQKPYCLFFYKTIYDFRLRTRYPLTYRDGAGVMYQPDRHFNTDQGTIPRSLQWCIQKDRFLGFYLHDSGYRFGGMYISRPEWALISVVGKDNTITFKPEFRFQEMTRKQIDDILLEMIDNDPWPANRATRYAIWSGVRAGGMFVWGRGDAVAAEPTNKIDTNLPPIAFA